jgi:hypothetical protein
MQYYIPEIRVESKAGGFDNKYQKTEVIISGNRQPNPQRHAARPRTYRNRSRPPGAKLVLTSEARGNRDGGPLEPFHAFHDFSFRQNIRPGLCSWQLVQNFYGCTRFKTRWQRIKKDKNVEMECVSSSDFLRSPPPALASQKCGRWELGWERKKKG